MEFEIELCPQDDDSHQWYASTTIDANGNLAIGSGHSPWEAITACYLDIPKARAAMDSFRDYMKLAEAGEAVCPGCRTRRPPLSKEACWALYCDTCRGELND